MLAQGFKETVGMAGGVNQSRLLIDPNAPPIAGPNQPGYAG